MSDDERVESKWEEFEAHKLEPERAEDGQVDLGRAETERVEGKVEDDDFEAHQLEVGRVEDGQVEIGRVEDGQVDLGRVEDA